MPYPSQPPYEAGALLSPRQLQRWLDVNKVSKLTRTETYWTLPAFSVEDNWLGYSQIVAAFNFVATNNFSLPLDYEVPTNPGYCACIMWVDGDSNVYRYRLWSDVGEVFYFDAPVYNGEVIKQNFRIEIWDCAPANFTSFTFNGAGVAGVNQLFEYDGGDTWLGTGDLLGLYVVPIPGQWALFDIDNDEMYYMLDTDVFPTGTWYVFGGTTAPAPYASISQTLTLAADTKFYTSVAGAYDYMWQDDNSMATASAIVTGFSVNVTFLNVFTLPMTWPADSVPVTN